MSNSPEPVLTASAFNKLKSRNLICESTTNTARWRLMQPLPFPISFPEIKFRDNIIPSAYDLPTFLVYLGFRSNTAWKMFGTYTEARTPSTSKNMMEFVKAHVNFIWLTSKYNGSAINSLAGYSLMGEIGFTEEFVLGDLWDFFNEARRDSMILENFFDENESKTLENMELIDWVQEFLYLRMLKLKYLDADVHDNLA